MSGGVYPEHMSRRSHVEVRAGTAPSGPGREATLAAIEGCDVPHLDPQRVAGLRAALIRPAAVDALAGIFKALGDPTRVRILDALSHGALCVCDLAQLVGMSPSAISHQLRFLRALRLVRSRRAGRMVFYALDDRHIVSLVKQGLRHVEEGVRPRGRLA